APTVDLGDSLDGSHLRLDDPIMNCSQLGDIVPLPGYDVVKDLAEAGRHGPHLRPPAACGQFDGGQLLIDELPGEVDVGAVFEGHDDLRKTEFRDRAHVLQPGQASDGLFD